MNEVVTMLHPKEATAESPGFSHDRRKFENKAFDQNQGINSMFVQEAFNRKMAKCFGGGGAFVD